MRLAWWLLGAFGLVGLAGGVAWSAVLISRDPVAHPLAARFPWPVVCSTRGCITTQGWQRFHQAAVQFGQATNNQTPTPTASLTSLVRQHLVAEAFVRSPVTPADSERYRREILNVTDAASIERLTGLTLAEYDELVVLPYLQQEALAAARHVETTDELFRQLAQERWIVALPARLQWDRNTASVR